MGVTRILNCGMTVRAGIAERSFPLLFLSLLFAS